jgi:hypothetical protein
VDQLPIGSATTAHRARLEPGWDMHALLLTDLFKAFTGQEHPARPKPKTASRYAEKRAALEAQRRRLGGAPTTT